MSFCARCSQPVRWPGKFCTHCGARLGPAGNAAPDTSPPGLATHPQMGFPSGDSRTHPAPPERRRPIAMWLPLAALVAVLGGLASWYLPGQHSTRTSASARSSSGAEPPADGGQPRAISGSPVASTPSPVVIGSTAVALSPGVSGQAEAGSVARFLTQYFAAINDHDYQAYISLFEPAGQQNGSAEKFRSGYRTTTDSDETLVALSALANGKLAASLTFDSHQDPADSATGTACTTWGITLYLVPAGTSYLIGHPPASYHASAQPCP